MPFVKAICSNCGATLTVDDNKEAATCEYCGTPYVVEKAVNTYNTTYNIENANITLMNEGKLKAKTEAAEKFLAAYEWDTAKRFSEDLMKEFPEDYHGYLYYCMAVTKDWTDFEYAIVDANRNELIDIYKMAAILIPSEMARNLQEKYDNYSKGYQAAKSKDDRDATICLISISVIIIALAYIMTII